jgi:tetratricopeptide (TPR) repeat protein
MSRGNLMRRALYLALVTGFLTVSSPAPAAADATTASEVVQAERLYSDGKFKEAIDLLNHYLTAHPQDATALVDRGDDYEALNEQQSAIADYSAALAINPEYAYAYASRCESYREIDQNDHALQDCNKAIELDPKLAYPYRERAILEA